MKRIKTNLFFDQNFNLYNKVLSGRRFSAVGVTDDHVLKGVSTPDRESSLITTVSSPRTGPFVPVNTDELYFINHPSTVTKGTTAVFEINTVYVPNDTLLYHFIEPTEKFHPDFSNQTFTVFSPGTGSNAEERSAGSTQFTVHPLLDGLRDGPIEATLEIRNSKRPDLTDMVVLTTTFAITDPTTTPPPADPPGTPTTTSTTTPAPVDPLPTTTEPPTTPPPSAPPTTTTTTTPEPVYPEAPTTTLPPLVRAFITPEEEPVEIDNFQLQDEHGSRIVFNNNFDITKDLYVSFQSPDVSRLITEDSEFVLLTEDNDILIINLQTCFSTFLVNGDTEVDTSSAAGMAGIGCCLMAISGSDGVTNRNLSGHICSVALDTKGGYGVSRAFLSAGTRGNLKFRPDTTTVRVSNTSSEFAFLSTEDNQFNNIFESNFSSYRISFKQHLSKILVDVKLDNDEKYTNIFEADTFLQPNEIPHNVKVGFAASGDAPFNLKDITYSN